MATDLVMMAGDLLRGVAEEPCAAFASSVERAALCFRFLELSAEQCDGIAVLCHDYHYRPAAALLRVLLETAATVCWISMDAERHADLFYRDKLPNVRARLDHIGWSAEYERTFQPLCAFVHADPTGVEGDRSLDSLNLDAPSPEIGPGARIHLEPGSRLFLDQQLSQFEQRERHEPYLAAKTFDIAFCTARFLVGDDPNAAWWPAEAIDVYRRVVASQPGIDGQMRYSSQHKLFE